MTNLQKVYKKKSLLMMLVMVMFFSVITCPQKAEASSVQLDKTEVSCYKDYSCCIKVIGTAKRVNWSCSDKNIATVDCNGKIIGKSKGRCVVKAIVDNISYSCDVTVKQPVTCISLNKTCGCLWVGKMMALRATVLPLCADCRNVTWCSSNTNIATVDSCGNVIAKSAGIATITCKSLDGCNKISTCKVTVCGGLLMNLLGGCCCR